MSDARTTADVRQYEIMFIVAGDKTDATVSEVSKHVKDEISTRGGTVTQEDAWGLRDFTYPIRRQQNGYYTVMNFSLPANMLNDFNKHLRLNTNVLRFLVTSLPENYKFVTFQDMQARGKKVQKGGRREADAISAEGSKMRHATTRPTDIPVRATTVEPAPLAPRKTRVAAVAPEVTASPTQATEPVSVKKPIEKAKPAAPAMSEEDRLKELDRQLEELIKEDDI